TGHEACHVERAITSGGAGSETFARKPLPGSAGSASGRVKRRLRRAGGVVRPVAPSGNSRVPSHDGGTVPGAGTSAVGVGVWIAVAAGLGSTTVEEVPAVGPGGVEDGVRTP